MRPLMTTQLEMLPGAEDQVRRLWRLTNDWAKRVARRGEKGRTDGGAVVLRFLKTAVRRSAER